MMQKAIKFADIGYKRSDKSVSEEKLLGNEQDKLKSIEIVNLIHSSGMDENISQLNIECIT